MPSRSIGITALMALAVWSPLASAENPVVSRGTLLQFDFESPTPWPQKPAASAGTIDAVGTKDASAGLLLVVDAAMATGAWSAPLGSGPLAVSNAESNLGKLTLAFSLSVSSSRPVRVRVESFDAQQHRTGGVSSAVYPAAADFFQRFAIDLSTMKPTGDGKFNPADPFVGITYELASEDGWPAATKHALRVDNVHYARPALYVRPDGDDTHDGLTEQTALATPQKAIAAARPGDIVLLMDGTYDKPADQPTADSVVSFVRSGTPAAWITLKNYPGQSPVISAAGQQGVRIQKSTDAADPGLAYLEVRGLHVRGNGEVARDQVLGKTADPVKVPDSNGILLFGRGVQDHHIRIADNTVEFCGGDGIHVDSIDWLFLEHNDISNNMFASTGYAPAALAVFKYANFDTTVNVPKMLIAGNRVHGNRLYVKNSPWGPGKPKTGYFNGNGILIDDNGEHDTPDYNGRTLVQNNLVFNNGAGGIQMWGNHRMDLVNNTVYLNGTHLGWGQFGFEKCLDVRFMNNVVVGQPNGALDAWFVKNPDKHTADIVRASNLFFGGAKPPVEGSNTVIADPQFVNPSADPAVADFRLKPGSAAVASGVRDTFIPAADRDGKPRGETPSRGAYE